MGVGGVQRPFSSTPNYRINRKEDSGQQGNPKKEDEKPKDKNPPQEPQYHSLDSGEPAISAPPSPISIAFVNPADLIKKKKGIAADDELEAEEEEI